MKLCAFLLVCVVILGLLPSALAAPSLSNGSYALYQRVTTSQFLTLNGTFRWDVKMVSSRSPIAQIAVLNNRSYDFVNFTYYVDMFSRIEIPSYTIAYQNPASSSPQAGADHATKTFFWIDTDVVLGSVVETVLGSAFVNGTAPVPLRSGATKNCWTLVSKSLGQGGFGGGQTSNATIVFWYDQKTGLLVKLDSESSSGQFGRTSDVLELLSTNIDSAASQPLTMTATEWASLTMSTVALILGGFAVAVAMDLRQFRRKRAESSK